VGAISTEFDRDWDDTWRIAAGLEWHVDEAKEWTLRTGFSYDSSPIDDDDRLPDIPVGEQYRFSIGGQRDFGSGKVFSLAYTFLYTPMDVDNVQLPGANIVLDGEYDPSWIHFFTASYSIKF
jgi:long-subunit fatty acid transport protein